MEDIRIFGRAFLFGLTSFASEVRDPLDILRTAETSRYRRHEGQRGLMRSRGRILQITMSIGASGEDERTAT